MTATDHLGIQFAGHVDQDFVDHVDAINKPYEPRSTDKFGRSEAQQMADAMATEARIKASWKADPSRDPGYTTGSFGRNRGRA